MYLKKLASTIFAYQLVLLVSIFQEGSAVAAAGASQIDETRFDCLDTLTDFEGSDWTSFPNKNVSYAPSTWDLPPTIGDGQLGQANGIFYYEGISDYQGIYRLHSNFWNIRPILLYVKYYSHLTPIGDPPSSGSILSFPALQADSGVYKFLPPTSNFEWGEQLIQIDGDHLKDSYLGVQESSFLPGEYFLIDKMIVAQGYPQDFGMEDVKALCPSEEVPIRTTTTTEYFFETTTAMDEETTVFDETTTMAVETTTQIEDVCSHAGFFAHAHSCTSYHVCLFDAFGLTADLLFHCPAPQIFCEETKQCQSPQFCTCHLDQ